MRPLRPLPTVQDGEMLVDISFSYWVSWGNSLPLHYCQLAVHNGPSITAPPIVRTTPLPGIGSDAFGVGVASLQLPGWCGHSLTHDQVAFLHVGGDNTLAKWGKLVLLERVLTMRSGCGRANLAWMVVTKGTGQ